MGSDGNPHAGHRERVRKKVAESGLDAMPEHEVLEYLLFYCIPRGDVNEIAHALIDRFGSLAGVFDANFQKLLTVDGVGESTALFLSSMPSVFRRYRLCKINRPRFQDIEQLRDFVAREVTLNFVGRTEEVLLMATLSTANTLLSIQTVSSGTVNSVNIPIRKIVDLALSVGAVKILLAHNHPHGMALPSEQDISATRALCSALRPLGIDVLDHIIVGMAEAGGYDYTSMRDSAMLMGC